MHVIEPVLSQLQSGNAGKQVKALKQIINMDFGDVARREAITRADCILPLVALVRTGSIEAQHYAAHALGILAQSNAANSQAAIANAGGPGGGGGAFFLFPHLASHRRCSVTGASPQGNPRRQGRN